jgi:hypothetical protein
MMRRVAPILFMVFVFALVSLLSAERPGAADEPTDLVVLATASNRGEVDPCG